MYHWRVNSFTGSITQESRATPSGNTCEIARALYNIVVASVRLLNFKEPRSRGSPACTTFCRCRLPSQRFSNQIISSFPIRSRSDYFLMANFVPTDFHAISRSFQFYIVFFCVFFSDLRSCGFFFSGFDSFGYSMVQSIFFSFFGFFSFCFCLSIA